MAADTPLGDIQGLGPPPGAGPEAPPMPFPPGDPNAWNGTGFSIASGVAIAMATVAVALRFWARAYILRVVALEDWLILASLGASIGITAMLGPMYAHGFGKHVVTLSPEDVNENLKYSFVVSLLYIVTLTFTKLSILCLYLRVLVYDYVRLAAKVLLAIVLITHAYIIATMLTACIPLEAFWDYQRRPTAYCHGMDIYWSHAGLNIVTDFLIFLLPLTILHRIRSPRPQKIALAVIFLLAFSVCSISLARAILLAKDVDRGMIDVTWEGPNTGIWNAFEVNIAIVCACLITLKPVGAKIFPRLFTPHPSASVPGSKQIEEAMGPRSPAARWGSEDADLVETVDEDRRRRGGNATSTEEEVVVMEKAR